MNSEEIYIDSEFKKVSYFFDSYAFFEILYGNPQYSKYKSAEISTTKLNLFELYLGILRDHTKEEADIVLDIYYPFAVDFDDNVIKAAAKMKKELAKRHVSMADCIGYCMAKILGIKFLTGDKEFENLDNVEFVK